MGTLFWVYFAVILIPYAEGALFALLLREIYARHPLPFFDPDTIPRKRSKSKAEVQETADESVISGVIDNGEPQMGNNEELPTSSDVPPTESTEDENTSVPSVVSVFDGSGNVPQNLQINDVLNSMTAESSAIVPNDLEHRIEEAALPKNEFSYEFQEDQNLNDLNDLAASLLKTPIDFSQEDEVSPEISDPISPMAKELLGDNFDFDALQKQAKQSSEALVSLNETNVEMMLDIQEDEAGIVQVSSPFSLADSIPLADFATPQTVLSTFSDDWVQESGNTVESAEGDISNFCFSEESQPMFVRKKKAN